MGKTAKKHMCCYENPLPGNLILSYLIETVIKSSKLKIIETTALPWIKLHSLGDTFLAFEK